MIDGEPTMTTEEIVEMAHRLMHAKDQLAEKYNKVRELVSGQNVEEVCDNILALKFELKLTKRALWLARAERAKIKADRIWEDNHLYLASKLDDFFNLSAFRKMANSRAQVPSLCGQVQGEKT